MSDPDSSRDDLILSILAEDRQFILYRPRFAALTGDPLAAILLQQMIHFWKTCGREPFYKFRDACKHERYRAGDSWCEELEWPRYAFDKALKIIATKVVKGVSKDELLASDIPIREEQEGIASYCRRFESALRKVVIYWTDSSRVTWYQVNETLLGKFVGRIYLDKSEGRIYLINATLRDTWKVRRSDLPVKTESLTEITAEIDSISPQGERRKKTAPVKDPVTRFIDEDLNLDALEEEPAAQTTGEDPQTPSSARPLSPGVEEPKTRAPNPWYDAVHEVWGYTAALNGMMGGMLQGKSKRKGWKDYNIDPPLEDPETLKRWAAWYRWEKQDGDARMSMIAEPIKVQSSIGEWRALGMPDPSAPIEDAIMDAVRLHLFKVVEPGARGRRMEMIASWLRGTHEDRNVSRISKPVEARHIAAFAGYWKGKGIDMPKDLDKFVDAWRAWASTQRSVSPAAGSPQAMNEGMTPEEYAAFKAGLGANSR